MKYKYVVLILCAALIVLGQARLFAMQLSKNLDADFTIGVLGGFENNAYLDSSRKGDIFTQDFLDSDITFKVSDLFRLKLKYYLDNITYSEVTDNSFLSNTLEPGFQLNFSNKLILDGRYNFQAVDYYKNERGEFIKNGAVSNIRYYLTDNLFFDAGYIFAFYKYDDFKAKGADKIETDSTREDARHIINGDIGIIFKKGILLKLKGNYCFNDSNDKYNDYYDYEYYTLGASLIHPVTKRLFGVWGGSYQRKDFDSRRTLDDSAKIEHDDLYTLNAGLYYQLTRDCLLGATYTYLQNHSNEPIQEYSDSIVTCGIYYSF